MQRASARSYFRSVWDWRLLPTCCWLKASWKPSALNGAAVQGLPCGGNEDVLRVCLSQQGGALGSEMHTTRAKSCSLLSGYLVFMGRALPNDLPIPTKAVSPCFSSFQCWEGWWDWVGVQQPHWHRLSAWSLWHPIKWFLGSLGNPS